MAGQGHDARTGALAGRGVIVTRARSQSEGLVAALEGDGAEVVEVPSIAFGPPSSWEALDAAVRAIDAYAWIVFSSANGVGAFVERLQGAGRALASLAGPRLAAVGKATAAALEQAGRAPEALPGEFRAEALAEALVDRGVAGRRVLVVRAQEGREELVDRLRGAGARVDLAPAYRTVRPEVDIAPVRARLVAGGVHAVVFASPSAVRNYASFFAPGEAARLHRGVAAVVIGPVTEQAAREAGFEVKARAGQAGAEELVEAVRQSVAQIHRAT